MLDFVQSSAPAEMIFVHGAGGNNLFWKRTMQYLSGGKKAFAVNLPGHPTGSITCRTIPEYADAVDDFIRESGIRDPVVCGHSMGSAIALELTIQHPEDVGGLVLFGAGAKLGVAPAIVEGLRREPMKTIENLITPMSYYKIDLGLGREARAGLSFTNLPVFLNDYLACNGFDVRGSLRKISAKTLLVCGENDKMTPPKWTQYLQANILNSSAFFVRDTGHMAPLEKPESCAGLIQNYFS